MAIYLARHPSRVGKLLKYSEIIRTASIQFPGQGWKTYDEQFRMKQATNPARSWGNLDVELWLTVVAVSVLGPVSAASRPGSAHSGQNPYRKSLGRPGLCFAYNGRRGCPVEWCRYTHACTKCLRVGHGATTCRMAGSARWVNNGAAARGDRMAQQSTIGRPQVKQSTVACPPVSETPPVRAGAAARNFRASNTN